MFSGEWKTAFRRTKDGVSNPELLQGLGKPRQLLFQLTPLSNHTTPLWNINSYINLAHRICWTTCVVSVHSGTLNGFLFHTFAPSLTKAILALHSHNTSARRLRLSLPCNLLCYWHDWDMALHSNFRSYLMGGVLFFLRNIKVHFIFLTIFESISIYIYINKHSDIFPWGCL